MLFCFWNRVLTRHMPLEKPEPAPLPVVVRDIAGQTRRAALGLAMPMIILGCIYGGVTTPTEAAAIAVLYAIPISIWYYPNCAWPTCMACCGAPGRPPARCWCWCSSRRCWRAC